MGDLWGPCGDPGGVCGALGGQWVSWEDPGGSVGSPGGSRVGLCSLGGFLGTWFSTEANLGLLLEVNKVRIWPHGPMGPWGPWARGPMGPWCPWSMGPCAHGTFDQHGQTLTVPADPPFFALPENPRFGPLSGSAAEGGGPPGRSESDRAGQGPHMGPHVGPMWAHMEPMWAPYGAPYWAHMGPHMGTSY